MSERAKESFLLFKSFYEPIKHLINEDMGLLFRAIFEFQLTERNPENPVGYSEAKEDFSKKLPPQVAMAFAFFKNQFDLDNQKYLKVVERNQLNGSRGGRPKTNLTERNPENPVGYKKPRKADNDTDNDIKVIDKSITKAKPSFFQKPSIQEISDYCFERQNSINPNQFFDFYESKGWKIGNNAMKNWQAAIRQWETRQQERVQQQRTPQPSRFQMVDIDYDAVDAMAPENL